MKKKILLATTIFYLYLPLCAMEIIKHKDNRDLFSQQPNKIRKQILLPLISRCTNYNDAKNILLSVGLVSKKSYEQINCIFFITDVIALLVKKTKRSNGVVALHLGTPGSLLYGNLGKSLHHVAINNRYPREQVEELRSLLNRGANVNFQTANFNTTALMKATARSNPLLVVYLVGHGAHIHAKSNNKYVREHSVLYEKEELTNYFYLLTKFMEKEKENKTPNSTINEKLYTSVLGSTIRNALAIDSYLECKGSIVHKHNKNRVITNLVNIQTKMPLARYIHQVITDDLSRLLPKKQSNSQ